jgi:Uma2 family endonuclease
VDDRHAPKEVRAMGTTAAAPETRPAAAEAVAFRPYRMTAERFFEMVDTGVFDKTRVFLWNGELVEKMAPARPHTIATTSLMTLLSRLVPQGWHVTQEQPIALSHDKAPEPDIAVARGGLRDYPRRPPTARDLTLLVEVAESSLRYDEGEVLRAFATAEIPVYWVVNLPERRVEVYTEPSGPADPPSYRRRNDYAPNDEVPVVLDGREVGRILVREVLP